MNSADFRKFGYQMIDFIANLNEGIPFRDPTPNVQPGFMKELVPSEPPELAEPFPKIMADLEPIILKGVRTIESLIIIPDCVTSPLLIKMPFPSHQHYHGYQPSGNGWPSILANILCNCFGCDVGVWASSPAATELEMIMMDWMAKFLQIPDFFLSPFCHPDAKGGGCIQASGTEATLVALLAAREQKLFFKKHEYPNTLRAELKSRLIAYCSQESHSSFAKACRMAGVKFRPLETNERGEITKTALRMAIREDRLKGNIPFFFNAMLGSTSVGTFDDLVAVGPTCHEQHIWVHGNAGYAGNCFCCEELSYLRQGLEYLNSLTVHANEWLDVTFECALFWVKEKARLIDVFSGFNVSLHHQPMVDYRYWGINSFKRFRALKLWFTLRLTGQENLRNQIRRQIYMARVFDAWVRRDVRFETVTVPKFGLVAFKLAGESRAIDLINAALVEAINSTHKLFLTPAVYKGQYVIRFMVTSSRTTEEDIDFAWQWISDMAEVILKLRELQSDADANTQELLEQAKKWKKCCRRKVNIEFVTHLKKYAADKAAGTRDFLAQQTAHIMDNTVEDLIKLDEINSLLVQSDIGKEDEFKTVSKESGRPRIPIFDSADLKYMVAGNFFHDFDYED